MSRHGELSHRLRVACVRRSSDSAQAPSVLAKSENYLKNSNFEDVYQEWNDGTLHLVEACSNRMYQAGHGTLNCGKQNRISINGNCEVISNAGEQCWNDNQCASGLQCHSGLRVCVQAQ